MTLNSIKNRVEKLSKSKHKEIHVFAINETKDSPEKKTEIYKQIEQLESQGEKPLLITIRTMTGPYSLERK